VVGQKEMEECLLQDVKKRGKVVVDFNILYLNVKNDGYGRRPWL